MLTVRIEPKKIPGLVKLVLVLFGTVLVLYLLHPFYLAALGHSLIVQDDLEQADAIVVLAGGSKGGERLLHAIHLWRSGYAPVVILSAPLADWQSDQDFRTWRHAKTLGVLPKENLFLSRHTADSTREEARQLLPYVLSREYRSVILVTNDFHTRRARNTFRNEWAGAEIQVMISSAPTVAFNPDDWWTRRKDSKVFIQELAKTVWNAVFE